MSVNNTTWDPSCPDRAWYAQTGRMADIVESIITPIYIIFAIFGRCLCLKAFHTKSKQESAYMYQIFTTVSEAFEVIGWGLVILVFHQLAGFPKVGQVWFQSCYICMKFAAAMGSSLIYLFSMMSQFFTICMSADRLYALWKPNKYHLANTNRNHFLAVFFCVGVSIVTSFYLGFTFSVTIVKNGTTVDSPLYQIVRDPPHPHILQLVTLLYTTITAVGLILLYFLNVTLLYFYHIRVVKAGKALNLTSEQKKREEGERTLFLLTLCQCIWMTLSITEHTIFLVSVFFVPTFLDCSGLLYVPFYHGFEEIVDMCDLLSICMISRQFRHMVCREIPCCGASNTIEPAQIVPGQRNVPSMRRHHN